MVTATKFRDELNSRFEGFGCTKIRVQDHLITDHRRRPAFAQLEELNVEIGETAVENVFHGLF